MESVEVIGTEASSFLTFGPRSSHFGAKVSFLKEAVGMRRKIQLQSPSNDPYSSHHRIYDSLCHLKAIESLTASQEPAWLA
jgi:hypothetical protein